MGGIRWDEKKWIPSARVGDLFSGEEEGGGTGWGGGGGRGGEGPGGEGRREEGGERNLAGGKGVKYMHEKNGYRRHGIHFHEHS